MDGNPTDEELRDLLSAHSRLAVVGLSPKPHRASHEVSAYMQDRGYAITPVNPRCEEVLGELCVPDLATASERDSLEIVNVFRRSEDVPPIVDEAIAARVKIVWLQLGITHDGAAERARAVGITVVQDRCIKIEHARLLGGSTPRPG